MTALDSGGGDGGSDDQESRDTRRTADEDAVGQLSDADQGSTESSSIGGSMANGVTSGGGETARSGGPSGPREQADEQLTRRDTGSDGSGGARGRGKEVTSGGGEATQTAPDATESSQQDTTPGRGGSGASSAARTARGVTSGGGEVAASVEAAEAARQREQGIADVERQVAEGQVDATLEEGIEGRGGGRRQELARRLEQRVIEEDDRVDSPDDVVIVEEDGELVPKFSRSAQVEATAEDLDLKEEIVRGFKRDRRPVGEGLSPGSAIPPVAEDIDVSDIDEVTIDDAGELGVTFSEDFFREAGPPESPDAEPVDEPAAEPVDRAPLSDRLGDLAGDVREEGLSSVERGGALSEAARNTTAAALGVYYSKPSEGFWTDTIGISDERARAKNTDFTGPGVTAIGFDTPGVTPIDYESGDPGSVNEEVLTDLTAGGGVLSDEQRAELSEDIEQRREAFDFSDEAGGFVGDVTGSEKAEGVASGVGTLPGEALSATAAGTLLADDAIRTAPNVSGAIDEHGLPEVATTSLEVTGRGVDRLHRGATEKPYEFIGSLGGAVVGGAVVSKAIRGTPSAAREAEIRVSGGKVHDLDDLSAPPTTTGSGLPGFTKRAQKDPDFAAREFVEQAKKGPLAQPGRRIDFDVRLDPDSPAVSLGPNAAAAIRNAPGTARQKIVGAGQTARQLPGKTAQRVDEAAFSAGERAGRRLGDVDEAAFQAGVRTGKRVTDAEDFLKNLPDAVDDAAFRAGVRTGEKVGDIEKLFASTGRPSPRELAAGAVGRLDDAAFEAGRVTGARLGDLDDAAFRGGVRVGERLADVDAAAFSAGERLGRGTRRVQDLPGTLDDAAFRAGVRTGKRVTDAEDFLERLPDALDDAAFEAGRRTGERLGDLDQAAFRAGVKTGEKVGDIEDLIESAPTSVGDVDELAFEAGRRTGERLGDLDEAAFQTGTRVGERLGDVDAAAFSAGETIGATTRRLQDLPGELDDAAFAAGRRTGKRLGDVDEAAFQAGVRTGRRVSDAEDFLEDLPGRVDDAAFEAGVKTGEKVGDIEDFVASASVGRPKPIEALDDVAFEAGRRTGETIRRVEGLEPSNLKDLTVELDVAKPDATPVAFHGRDPEAVAEFGGFGREFEAPVGGSELPGFFQSADLSPLRIGGAGESGGLQLPKLGLPSARARSSRVLAEEDIDVDVTEGRSNREVSDFLMDDASREKSFIRTDSGGGPTPEQEVIAPPGSTLAESGGKFGVRVGGTKIPFTDISVGGEVIPGRLAKRADADLESDLDDFSGETVTSVEAATETTEAIRSTQRRLEDEPTTVAPIPPTTPATTASSSPDVDATDAEPISSPVTGLDSDLSSSVSSPSSIESTLGGSFTSGGSGSGPSSTPPTSPPPSSTSTPPTSPPSPPSSPGSPPPPTVTETPPGPPSTPETPPPPPPTPVFDIDIPEGTPPDRKRGFEFFRREFIAPVEENPLSAIDEDLKNL